MGRCRRFNWPKGEDVWLLSVKRERGQNGKEHSERVWHSVFVPEGDCLQPSVISTKARIREVGLLFSFGLFPPSRSHTLTIFPTIYLSTLLFVSC